MEADKVKIQIHEVRLNEFLDDLRSGYAIPLDKEIRLTWDYPPDLPVLKTDGDKLRHILQNLIGNAIKFTAKGSVIVSARLGEDGRPQAEESPPLASCPTPHATPEVVEFKVKDTGIGISPDDLPVIFDKFRQVDSSETRPYGGVGIGLYIVKTFVELLGGEIYVQSERGRGSTFTVRIPCEGPKRIVASGDDLIFI